MFNVTTYDHPTNYDGRLFWAFYGNLDISKNLYGEKSMCGGGGGDDAPITPVGATALDYNESK